jgi:hypothetical protein
LGDYSFYLDDDHERSIAEGLKAEKLLDIGDAKPWTRGRYYSNVTLLDPLKSAMNEKGFLCVGRSQLVSIDRRTESAADARGIIVTHVTFRYRIIDLPAWATSERVRAAFAGLRETSDIKGGIMLEKTTKGWQH